MNFNSILIGSEDPQRLADYYSKLLGEPMSSEGGYAMWMIGSGGLSVGPHSEVHGSNDQPGRMIWNIESEDVRADFARMKDAGAVVVREPYELEGADGIWIGTLADPDGNYFQLMSPFDPTQMEGQTG